MSCRRVGQDQRRSFRFPVPPGRQPATLHVGGRRYAGRLLNESAEGFGICLCEHPEVEPGAAVTIETSTGRSAARVAYVREDHLPLIEALRDTASTSRRWIVGLERTADLPDPQQLPRRSLWTRIPWAACQIVSLPTVLSGLGMAALCVLIPWAAISLGSRLNERTLRKVGVLDGPPMLLGEATGRTGSSKDRRPKNNHRANTATASPAPTHSRRSPPLGLSSLRNRWDDLRKRMARCPGPTALMLPEVAERLSLTDRQQAQIRQLLESAHLFREVSGTWLLAVPDPTAEEVQQRIAELENAAMRLLDDQQRTLYESLRGLDREGPPRRVR